MYNTWGARSLHAACGRGRARSDRTFQGTGDVTRQAAEEQQGRGERVRTHRSTHTTLRGFAQLRRRLVCTDAPSPGALEGDASLCLREAEPPELCSENCLGLCERGTRSSEGVPVVWVAIDSGILVMGRHRKE